MAQSVGQVSLDLILNSNQFRQQLNQAVNQSVRGVTRNTSGTISSAFSKIGKVAAAAFAVTSIVKFGSECVKLGSDLQEVDNVVSVAFKEMSGEADKFAKSALKNFGISETAAKRYMGTFGAMSSSFGYSTKESLEMSKTLTGLVGDVSSFYNISNDMAYTKLKSVFTGETESLKDLGVVMTQTALDQYALANGYGKTVKAMTEKEKVALRLAFVTDKLNNASGDFVRTQDSWANQTRILSETFNAFKAQLGQAFIQVLTPVIKWINVLMEKMLQLATVLNEFTAKVFGKQKMGSSGIGQAAGEMGELADQTGGVGDAAESTAKKIKKSIMGFDKLNMLQDNSDTGSGAGGSGLDLSSLSTIDTAAVVAETTKEVSALAQKMKELFETFKGGFSSVFNVNELIPIKDNINSIKTSLEGIFTSPKVLSSMNTFASKFAYSLGQITGSIADVGTTIGIALTGSIASYLGTNRRYLTDRVAGLFGTAGDLWDSMGDYAAALSEIFSVFRSETAQEIGGNIIEMFVNPLTALAETLLMFQKDVFEVITGPIVENATQIKQVFEDLLNPINEVTTALADNFTYAGERLIETYKEHISPFLQNLKDGLSELMSEFLTLWTEYVQPVLDSLGEKFSTVMEENVRPMLDEFFKLIGKVADMLSALWENILKPLISWIMKTIIPILAPIFKFIGEKFIETFKTITTVITNILKIFGGLIDFITGVLTGDWEKAWNGIKAIFKGVWDSFVSIVKTPINLIIDIINGLINKLNNAISVEVPDWVPGMGGEKWGLNIPNIPKLANGGYVAANTPQLAIVGDNKREGEVIAPDSKIQENVAAALTPMISAIQQLTNAVMQGGGNVGNITIPVFLDGNQLDTVIVNAQNRQAIRTGGR